MRTSSRTFLQAGLAVSTLALVSPRLFAAAQPQDYFAKIAQQDATPIPPGVDSLICS